MMFGYNGRLQRWYILPLSLTCIPALTMHPCFSAEPTSYLLPLLYFSFYLFLVLLFYFILFYFILFIMFNLFIVYCQLSQMTFNKDILARKMERIPQRCGDLQKAFCLERYDQRWQVETNNVLFFFNSFESNHYSNIPPGKSLTSLPLIPYSLVEQRSSRMDLGLLVWIRQSDYRFTPAPVSPGVVQPQGSTCNIPGTTPSMSSFLSSLSYIKTYNFSPFPLLGYVNGAQIAMYAQGYAEFAMKVFQTRLRGMLREFIRENIFYLFLIF